MIDNKNANSRSQQATVSGIGPAWTYTRRGYALAQSIRQLKRHRLASIGTLLVLGITLALPAMLYFASATLASLSENGFRDESLTAYLELQISNSEGAELASQWQARADVKDTRFIGPDQALAMLQEDADIRDAMQVLGENPLPGAVVVYPVSTMNTQSIESLAETLRSQPQVARVQVDLQWVKRLDVAVRLGQWIGGLMAGFLSLTALFVILNTIRLELSRRRAEMEVTNLLGAPTRFMYRPIIYTGALYGLLGGVIACILALLTLNAIRTPADELSSLYNSTFILQMPESTQILTVLGISLVMGLVGAIGSLSRSSRQLTHQE